MWFKKRQTPSTTNLLFSSDWIKEWKHNLDESHDFRTKSAKWSQKIVLKSDPPSPAFDQGNATGILIDLKYGEIVSMRYSTRTDHDQADLIISSDPETWSRMLRQKKDPTMLIMSKKLKLEKGSLVLLSIQKKSILSLIEQIPGFESKRNDHHIKSAASEPVDKKRSYKTTEKGLDFESFPMKLFQKAKKFGIWDPAHIDYTKDRQDWMNLSKEEHEIILHLTSLFLAGEEAVTKDLMPLMKTLSDEGRVEEEIYLTSFLWEEAKHTEFFSICMQQVFQTEEDLNRFHGPFYKTIFYQKLPNALNALEHDRSPRTQLRASATYNLIVEGTLAETGYTAFGKMLTENDIMPGIQTGIEKLKQDESRHIAFGIYLIKRLLDKYPDERDDFENELEELLTDSTNMIHEIFEPYEDPPFGLQKEWFLNHAIKQFQRRLESIQ